jgi:hypothetical protein
LLLFHLHQWFFRLGFTLQDQQHQDQDQDQKQHQPQLPTMPSQPASSLRQRGNHPTNLLSNENSATLQASVGNQRSTSGSNSGSNPASLAGYRHHHLNQSQNGADDRMQNDNGHGTRRQKSLLQSCLTMITSVLRALSYPLHRAFFYMLPGNPNDYDGLSSAVTSKAALQFVNYIQSQQPKPIAMSPLSNILNIIPLARQSDQVEQENQIWVRDVWTVSGFMDAQQEAFRLNGLILVYLQSPFHYESQQFVQRILAHTQIVQWLAHTQQPSTHQSNHSPVLCVGYSIHTAQGLYLSQLLSLSSYPFLALLQPKNATGNLTMLLKVEGPLLVQMCRDMTMNINNTHHRFNDMINPTTLLSQLQLAHARHVATVVERETQQLVRLQEQELRRQQDEEYQATLAADRERLRVLQEEKAADQREQEKIIDQETQKQLAKEMALTRAQALLRPEPPSSTAKTETIKVEAVMEQAMAAIDLSSSSLPSLTPSQTPMENHVRNISSISTTSNLSFNSNVSNTALGSPSRDKDLGVVQVSSSATVTPDRGTSSLSTCMIRFVFPSGAKVNRRFVRDEDTVETLRAFVLLFCHENNISMSTIGLSTSYPKQSFNDDDCSNKTLEQLGFASQVVLMVQDLDT